VRFRPLPHRRADRRRSGRRPGIEARQAVSLSGLPDSFWNEWAANRALFPCGADLVFAAGSDLIALPRSIAVET
jgi:alpha-D-ribose 1-methylphosphonate 5-triphosphate synthase subunit PhnH